MRRTALTALVALAACSSPAPAPYCPVNASATTKLVYAPCKSGAPVVLWKMSGSGHVWPGKDAKVEKILGKPNHLIDANAEIWSFVRNYTR